MKAIVLTFERLATRFLGCYGNDLVATPHWDHLASMATVFDHCLTESANREHMHDVWSGCHLHPSRTHEDVPDLLGELRAQGVTTRLIYESPSLLDARPRPDFDQRTPVDGISGADAEDFETPLAQLVAESCRQLESWSAAPQAELLWMHSQAIPIPWIPPQAWAAEYFEDLTDEEDDESETDTDDDNLSAADTELDGPGDDDLLDFEEFVCSGGRLKAKHAWAATGLTAADWSMARAAYAGYVSMVDACLGALLDAVEAVDDRLLLVVTSLAGQCVRNVQNWTPAAENLREEDLHCPLLIYDSANPHSTRRPDLVQHVDLPQSLLDWFGCTSNRMEGQSLLPALRNEPSFQRDYVCCSTTTHRGIRSRDFALVVPREADSNASDADALGPGQLYVKPDDYWEVTDLQAQYPLSAQQLAETLQAYESACGTPPPANLPRIVSAVDARAPKPQEAHDQHTTQDNRP